jgi:sulfonate transport system substrate-binding protein
MRGKAGRATATILVCFILVAILPGACSRQSETPAGPPEKITIAYTTTFSAVLVQIAFAKGFFIEEGLDATPQPYATGKMALDALLEGKADMATAADTPIADAIMDGRKIMILTAIQTASRNQAIVAMRDRGIEKPSDLRGKTIGLPRGTKGDFFTDVFLLAHDIDRKKVRTVDLKPDEMAGALDSGRVDAVSAGNPLLAELQKSLGSRAHNFYAERFYIETFCLAARQDLVGPHPEVVRKVLRGLLKAEAFVQRYPDESRRLVADFVKADKALVDRIWAIYTFRVTLDQALVLNLEDQSRWAIHRKLTKRADIPSYLDFIYIDGLAAVKPEALRIVR